MVNCCAVRSFGESRTDFSLTLYSFMLSFRNDSDACIVIFITEVRCFYYAGDLFFTEDTFIVVSLIAHH